MIDVMDTIPWHEVMFVDCETRSTMPRGTPDANIKTTGVHRYADQAYPIIITWARGLDGEVKRWEWLDFERLPGSRDMPPELRAWTGYFAAHNSGFDRAILSGLLGTELDAWLDMMAHCAYNNLPQGLDRASKACGYSGKVLEGGSLISMFCPTEGFTPQTRPSEWERFCKYADVDVLMMQNIAGSTFPVPYQIWEDFWVSEKINDRGLPIDVDMARGGAALAAEYASQTNIRVSDITDQALYSVRQYDAQREWVWDRVRRNPFVGEHMIKARRTLEDGTEEYKLKLDRPTIVLMLAALDTLNEGEGLTDEEYAVRQFLEEREYGASAAPAKFQKMLDTVTREGTLPGQYVFSGATQTGRYSSRLVQVHNMTRSTVGNIDTEEDACVALIKEAA